jgi:hypothetical protein
MAPHKEPEPALAAPGLIGPMSIEKPPMGGPRSSRRSRNRPYAHVRLEVDIDPGPTAGGDEPARARRKGATSTRHAGTPETFLGLAVEMLHALASRQFRRVDSWVVRPEGAIVAPESKPESEGEVALGDLITSMEAAAKEPGRIGRSFRANVSDLEGNHVELALHHAILARTSKLQLDLTGKWTKLTVHALEGAIKDRLPVTRSEMVKYRYA